MNAQIRSILSKLPNDFNASDHPRKGLWYQCPSSRVTKATVISIGDQCLPTHHRSTPSPPHPVTSQRYSSPTGSCFSPTGHTITRPVLADFLRRERETAQLQTKINAARGYSPSYHSQQLVKLGYPPRTNVSADITAASCCPPVMND